MSTYVVGFITLRGKGLSFTGELIQIFGLSATTKAGTWCKPTLGNWLGL